MYCSVSCFPTDFLDRRFVHHMCVHMNSITAFFSTSNMLLEMNSEKYLYINPINYSLA
jgi:hypothetical protein